MTKAVHHWPAIALRFVVLERGAFSVLVADGAGAALEHRWPFPQHNLVLALIELRTPAIYDGMHFAYTLLLFTTPLVMASAVLSTGYINRARDYTLQRLLTATDAASHHFQTPHAR